MDFDKKAIGERIKEHRLKRGFTQADLAKQADITRIALGNYERGERIPTIDIFARIAMTLNVSMDELMGCYISRRLSGMPFKDHLKHLRENAGYKQAKDFAKAAGIPYSSYATYERGSWPNEANLTRIALALHVSIDELMGYTPSPLSTIQQIKQDFANVGYELKEEGSTWWRYEITKPGEEYPFHVKTEDDLKQIYHQVKLDVLHAQKKGLERQYLQVFIEIRKKKIPRKRKVFHVFTK